MTDDPVKTLVLGLIFFAAIMVVYRLFRSFRGDRATGAANNPEESFSRHETELIALLSLKYGLDDATIRKVIQVYKSDPADKKAAILEICHESGVKKEVVADIILKYREWIHSSNSVSETPEMPDDDWEKWIRWDR